MRAYQVFGRMDDDEAARFLAVLAEKAPAFHVQALGAAAAAMRARPQFVLRQSPEKRAAAVRRALARVAANDVAEELLAVYFLDCRKDVLVEWLDAVGLEHDEGTLKADEPTGARREGPREGRRHLPQRREARRRARRPRRPRAPPARLRRAARHRLARAREAARLERGQTPVFGSAPQGISKQRGLTPL